MGDYSLLCDDRRLPDLYADYSRNATLVDEFDISASEGTQCFVAVGLPDEWPFLVIAQRYDPAGGFSPGAILVPETKLLFVGAGNRLLCYTLDPASRLWEDENNGGFWFWQRYGNIIVTGAELEFAAWTIHGRKLWTAFVEPPWEHTVQEDMVHLNVMGTTSMFPLDVGPSRK